MPKIVTRLGIPLMLIVGVIFALVALFSAGGQPDRADGLDRFAIGDLEPLQFYADTPQPLGGFEDADGEMRTLGEWRGKVIVLNLWGEWCAPCIEEMPTLAELQTAFSREDVVVLAVAMDREVNREANRSTLASLAGDQLSFYFDMSYGLAYEARAAGFPTTLIYDRDGLEIARLSGAADWASEAAKGLISDLVAR
ncbi:MAG: TlpA disulfide reductase family protein [Pseudomonadota bacterium]